jgi:tetratricopeptide (TPR) repeat protein
MSERLEQLKKLHTVDPNDPFLTYGIALELAKDDLLEEAVTWLDKTIEMDADYCYAYYQKAKMYGEMGEDKIAIQAIKDGIEAAKRTNDGKALSELSELLHETDM